jgi:hypothetical protein
MTTLQEEVEAGLAKTSNVSDQIVPAIDKLIDKISPAISSLSDKLGTTAEHLWTILVRQTYNDAISNMIHIIFTCITLYMTFYATNIWYKKIKNDGWSSEGIGVIIGFRIFVSLVSLMIITENIIGFTQRLVNPEFYALQTVLNYIK